MTDVEETQAKRPRVVWLTASLLAFATSLMASPASAAASHLALSSQTLHAATTSVTISVSGGKGLCHLSVDPAIAGMPRPWQCSAAAHSYSVTILANPSTVPRTYRFTLLPTQTTAVLTQAAAQLPSVTIQPSNAVVGAIAGSSYSPSGASFTAAVSGDPVPTAQWYSSTPLSHGESWIPIGGATSDTLTVDSANFGSGTQFKASFTNSAGTVSTNPAVLYVAYANSAWSGYAVRSAAGAQFTSVSGYWTVPTVTCTSVPTESLTWVGIDGWGNNTVEQDGTRASCVGGIPTYSSWYEMWGNSALNNGYLISLDSGTYPTRPGDKVVGLVSLAHSVWTFSLLNIAAGWVFTTNVPAPTPPPAQTSAEWVVEDPLSCSTDSPSSCVLDKFAEVAPVTFTNISASTGTQSGAMVQFIPTTLLLDQSSVLLTQVSAPDSTFTSFTVSSVTPAAP